MYNTVFIALFFLHNYNVLYCRLICTDRSTLVLFTEGSFWLLLSPPSWALDSSLTSGKWQRVMLLKVKKPWLKLDLIFHAIISQNSIKVCKL